MFLANSARLDFDLRNNAIFHGRLNTIGGWALKRNVDGSVVGGCEI
jgi:hypothetical protein